MRDEQDGGPVRLTVRHRATGVHPHRLGRVAEEAFLQANDAGHDPNPGLALLQLAKGDIQLRLLQLGFWNTGPDGKYGLTTKQAVMAFQKAEGLSRDGIAGPETQSRLATAGRPSVSVSTPRSDSTTRMPAACASSAVRPLSDLSTTAAT